MQIAPISKVEHSSINNIHQTSFKQNILDKPAKSLSEKTLKIITSAIAATGIAGIQLQKESTAYSNALGKDAQTSNIGLEGSEMFNEMLENAPDLLEVLTNKDAYNNFLNFPNYSKEEQIGYLLDSYYNNPELTIKLCETKNNHGKSQYNPFQIKKIVKVEEESPEFMELAMRDPQTVIPMVNAKDDNNSPLFSPNDIETYLAIKDVNPNYINSLMKQKNNDGTLRFNIQQMKYLLLNGADQNELLNLMLNAKESEPYEKYRFTSDEIIQINDFAEKTKKQELIKNLIATTFTEDMDWSGEPYKILLNKDDIFRVFSATPAETVKRFVMCNAPKTGLKIIQMKNEKLSQKDFDDIYLIENRYGRFAFEKKDLKGLEPLVD